MGDPKSFAEKVKSPIDALSEQLTQLVASITEINGQLKLQATQLSALPSIKADVHDVKQQLAAHNSAIARLEKASGSKLPGNNDSKPIEQDFTRCLCVCSYAGIGYALAKKFLEAGDNIIICSRSAQKVESVVGDLKKEYGEQHVWGTVCDVRDGKDVKALVEFAREKFKHIDIWINNAGSNAYTYKPLVETSDEALM
ncbi:hypothetical protein PR202_ga12863 [Eleusine coracana subsp. coracana]|uniref:Uncharacterized protein n=1 Tax=Eleusine coracana subsp. coracana TaxID=191504 RepID=A0AAV5CD63_ELECO|nr:hypothetical protein PR202_ga12863 [Eleusine coracana subsp. coracana]